MPRPRLLPVPLFVAVLALAPAACAAEAAGIHHELVVHLSPRDHRLAVRDSLSLPAVSVSREVRFVLHAGLTPVVETGGVELERLPDSASREILGSLPGGGPPPSAPPLEAWRLLAAGNGELPRTLTLRYAGVVDHPFTGPAEEYDRSFGETAGTVGGEGVFLAGSTFWVPWLSPDLVSFSLEVESPPGWEAVSEGRRTRHEAGAGGSRVRWESGRTEEVHLVAGPMTVSEGHAGGVETYVYLRSPDPGLAARYLETGAAYLEMYDRLLGAYPYAKLAVVENFWETGYGMPSFTLLGGKVLRFPFILHSSYPHEILHNWWGNGVFVDPSGGNWSEGLTAYLADHLVQEGRGAGAEYRRDQLQKYADYVRRGNELPIAGFRSRHSAATAAVGYGKTAMVFHMLRRQLGDETFIRGLRRLYGERRGRRASFADVRAAFEEASGRDLGAFFRTWLERTGAPALVLGNVRVEPAARGATLRLELRQVQESEPFPLTVPVAVSVEGEPSAHLFQVPMTGRSAEAALTLPGTPLRVQVDPDFDLFRRLDPREIPPSLGRAFGAARLLLVLPGSEPPPLLAAYRKLAAAWSQSRAAEVEVTVDGDLDDLPIDRAVWILGWRNRFFPRLAAAVERCGGRLAADALSVGGETLARGDRSVALAVRHPASPELALAFLGADASAALPGLARKLPHYGKYGWLGFSGDEPTNVAKGVWPAEGSPLDTRLVSGAAAAPRPPRAPLATLRPAFSEAALDGTVRFLADEELAGRGCGSPGLARAADFIEAALRRAGLSPGAEDGGFRQRWSATCGEEGIAREMVNLVGVLPGSKPALAGQSVIVVAHYDHLGLGWPGGRAEDRGEVHPGADDNASGVAVLLELARVLASAPPPDRTVVFLATAGEEMGLLGSRAYAEGARRFPVSRALAAVNLDTVGRLGEAGRLLVLGTGSAAEWVHVVQGAGYVTGVASRAVGDDLGGSDQRSFLAAGVPAVQLTTGPHIDYHRPGDTADRVDVAGLARVAAFAREVVAYLASREGPLTASGAPSGSGAVTAGGGEGRRVSLGTVPDFAFEGPGCRLSGVVPGSPAEAAGLREGDVVVGLGEREIDGLRALARALAAHAPGDRVVVAYLRDGRRSEVEVTLAPR